MFLCDSDAGVSLYVLLECSLLEQSCPMVIGVIGQVPCSDHRLCIGWPGKRIEDRMPCTLVLMP